MLLSLFQMQLLDRHLTELELLDLPGSGHGKGTDELDIPGDLVIGDPSLAECAHLVFRHLRPLPENDRRHYLLAVLPVGDPVNLHIRDLRVGEEELLDLPRVDVLAAADDHVLDPAGDLAVTVLVHYRQVAGVKPAVGVYRLGSLLRHLVITLHDKVAAAAKFSLFARGESGSGLYIDYLF